MLCKTRRRCGGQIWLAWRNGRLAAWPPPSGSGEIIAGTRARSCSLALQHDSWRPTNDHHCRGPFARPQLAALASRQFAQTSVGQAKSRPTWKSDMTTLMAITTTTSQQCSSTYHERRLSRLKGQQSAGGGSRQLAATNANANASVYCRPTTGDWRLATACWPPVVARQST